MSAVEEGYGWFSKKMGYLEKSFWPNNDQLKCNWLFGSFCYVILAGNRAPASECPRSVASISIARIVCVWKIAYSILWLGFKFSVCWLRVLHTLWSRWSPTSRLEPYGSRWSRFPVVFEVLQIVPSSPRRPKSPHPPHSHASLKPYLCVCVHLCSFVHMCERSLH